jgi:predicted transcriptional regulator
LARKRSTILTEGELRLMDVLWDKNRATVSEIVAALRAPRPAYTTVQTTLNVLEAKGHIAHDQEGRAFYYRPLVSRDAATGGAVTHLVSRFFANRPGGLAVRLLESDTPIDDAELERLERLIADRKARR